MSVSALDTTWDAERAARLRGMKQRATGLLVLAALVFLGTFLLEDAGWVGYLRAGAEAAMVGGVADWFAVTALFRHPLGIPIPHTALIPRGKDAIGRGLGEFVTRNFLDADHLAERVQAADPAGTLAAWLADPAHAGSVAEHAARLAATLSGALDDADMQQHARAWLSDTVSRFDLAPIAASLATHAIEHGHHTPIIDTALRGVQSTLSESQTLLRNRMHQESPWWVPEQIDDAVFARIHVGLQRFISDVIADPDHDLRKQFDLSLLKAAEEARTSPEWQRAADELRDGLLEHPATSAWIDSLWTDIQHTIAQAAEQPEHEWRARLSTLVASVGHRLETDGELCDRLNRWATALARTTAQQFGGEASRLIASTVERWDARETSHRLELQVGRDLQFIRINGTLVGGLVGLLIHFLSGVMS